ncbi:AraC family transcriptional regulator [Oceanihabitans sediminis]|uniref:AraC family transcriptional regulator n=3 Tax=Oceanihabitans sediminis TaxID=1812012 RepID=A0A368P3Q2_9FLAO|nr:AraC family transcriptional regulator [Oceanihabitans sediminis]RCU56694.1 AraC family transcriptional regulator [Oceanihabitans sediminis]
MKFTGQNNEYIEIVSIDKTNAKLLNESKKSALCMVWFKEDGNKINIDAVDYVFNANEIISLTEFHTIKVEAILDAILIRWNRSFYCVVDHDSEVGCKGILYYGASTVPIIKLDEKHIDILTTLFKMLYIEMESRDNLQLEMLQMMLKRLLILCTRLYKDQHLVSKLRTQSIDIIREYNYLVEQHFKTKHTVKEYAQLLFKSPKTLSNLFKKYGDTTPQQFIQNRIMLEAKRLLTYTDKTISEIGFELGFSDVQAFSRFFSKQEGVSPQKFRNREVLPTK